MGNVKEHQKAPRKAQVLGQIRELRAARAQLDIDFAHMEGERDAARAERDRLADLVLEAEEQGWIEGEDDLLPVVIELINAAHKVRERVPVTIVNASTGTEYDVETFGIRMDGGIDVVAKAREK